MARRKNVKRIDPRYFLHETVNRGTDLVEGCPSEEEGEAIDISGPGVELHVDDIGDLPPDEAFAAGLAAARDAIDQILGDSEEDLPEEEIIALAETLLEADLVGSNAQKEYNPYKSKKWNEKHGRQPPERRKPNRSKTPINPDQTDYNPYLSDRQNKAQGRDRPRSRTNWGRDKHTSTKDAAPAPGASSEGRYGRGKPTKVTRGKKGDLSKAMLDASRHDLKGAGEVNMKRWDADRKDQDTSTKESKQYEVRQPIRSVKNEFPRTVERELNRDFNAEFDDEYDRLRRKDPYGSPDKAEKKATKYAKKKVARNQAATRVGRQAAKQGAKRGGAALAGPAGAVVGSGVGGYELGRAGVDLVAGEDSELRKGSTGEVYGVSDLDLAMGGGYKGSKEGDTSTFKGSSTQKKWNPYKSDEWNEKQGRKREESKQYLQDLVLRELHQLLQEGENE